MKDIQDIKGVEALEECIKMWRLNRTSPAQRRKRGRIQGPPGGFCSMDDETWDHIISTRSAPKGAKLFYQRGLNGIEYGEKPVYDHYRMMDDVSWDYIIAHAETTPLKADLADIREHMQGQPEGTNMFWWRGRHRPMHAVSFDEAKMREIAAELALAKMGYDDGRMWYTDECRDMTLEAMRLSGLKALYIDLPKEGHGSANFFFRGPFLDLHYWDESSRGRFVDVVHKMWAKR